MQHPLRALRARLAGAVKLAGTTGTVALYNLSGLQVFHLVRCFGEGLNLHCKFAMPLRLFEWYRSAGASGLLITYTKHSSSHLLAVAVPQLAALVTPILCLKHNACQFAAKVACAYLHGVRRFCMPHSKRDRHMHSVRSLRIRHHTVV